MICLIGYRATGKTTVARLVAARLGWPWQDADQVVEARAGRTIRQIFAEQGEPAFRDLEALVLAELCAVPHQVVATGGGCVLREDNRRQLRRARLIVWLTADADTLWERIRADAATAERRPTLTRGGRAEVEELLRVREPLYRACADLTLDTVACPPAALAEQILAHWQQHG